MAGVDDHVNKKVKLDGGVDNLVCDMTPLEIFKT
jgi:hypothetical protein